MLYPWKACKTYLQIGIVGTNSVQYLRSRLDRPIEADDQCFTSLKIRERKRRRLGEGQDVTTGNEVPVVARELWLQGVIAGRFRKQQRGQGESAVAFRWMEPTPGGYFNFTSNFPSYLMHTVHRPSHPSHSGNPAVP